MGQRLDSDRKLGIATNMLKRNIERSDIIRIAGIALFLGLAVWGVAMFARSFGAITAAEKTGNFLQDMQASAIQMKEYIAVQYPKAGVAVMLFLQALHVVASVIPSTIISFANGMIYGLWKGLLICTIGSAVGTAISFYLARLLGRRALTLFVSQKNIDKMEKMISGDTSAFLLLLLFIVPSPKDFFAYFLGLTNMKASKYFLISAVGRIPGTLTTIYLGTLALNQNPNYGLIIGCTVAALILTVLSFVFKDKLLSIGKK